MHNPSSRKWSMSGVTRLMAAGVKIRVVVPALIAIFITTLALSPASARGNHGGIVSSVDKAPIVPAGTTAGSATDFVITLDTSLDPSVPGRTLLAGDTVKVTLPDAFVNSGLLPIQQVGTPGCVPNIPNGLQCNTAVFLQGWPQHPVAPPKYSLSLEGTNTVVFTANVDLIPNAPDEPGIKQIHLILNSFINPHPGRYKILVEAETGAGGAVETGVGKVHILPNPRASINVTSAFVPGTPNRIYQATGTEELTPLPYDFLLWDKNGVPFVGVEIVPVDGGKHGKRGRHGHAPKSTKSLAALMVHEGHTVGKVFIERPKGATGYSVFTQSPSVLINSPISTAPTGRMTAFFRTGSKAGDYTLTFSVNGGNSVQMFVTAN